MWDIVSPPNEPVQARSLSVLDQTRILHLAEQILAHDHVYPLNDQALLDLSTTAVHLLVEHENQLLGYAHYHDSVAQIMVAPSMRRHHLATKILTRLQLMDPHTDLWAFGDLDSAQGFCTHHNFHPVRELLVMSRSTKVPSPSLPSTLVVSSFHPEDLEDLVRLNSRAFCTHPEQGTLTIEDFRTRISAPWFDPAGLILVRDNQGVMVGFIWTKIDHDQGEVYVIAVDPAFHNLGIGRVLLNEGLTYLGNMGVNTVRLWVDSNNTSAIVLYQRSGFTAGRRDVRYRRKETAVRVPA